MSRLETKHERAYKKVCQQVTKQPPFLDCLEYVTLSEPGFPLSENNHQSRQERKIMGKCPGCVDLADLMLRSSQMVPFNVKWLYFMSPADKTLSLWEEAVKSGQEIINWHFCSWDVLTLMCPCVKKTKKKNESQQSKRLCNFCQGPHHPFYTWISGLRLGLRKLFNEAIYCWENNLQGCCQHKSQKMDWKIVRSHILKDMRIYQALTVKLSQSVKCLAALTS